MKTDGYYGNDGYMPVNFTFDENWKNKTFQLNIKLSAEDMFAINEINEQIFDKEISNSTLGRILLKRGIKLFQTQLMEKETPSE